MAYGCQLDYNVSRGTSTQIFYYQVTLQFGNMDYNQYVEY